MADTQIVRTLAGHEDIIEYGRRSFIDVGQSLMAIRDEKLYAEKHDTFEAYCKVRWGFAKSHAYRLIESAVVVNGISETSPIGDTKIAKTSGKSQNAKLDHCTSVLPDNEAQARALADASDDPKVRAKIWAAAVERSTNGDGGSPHVTAGILRVVASELFPKDQAAADAAKQRKAEEKAKKAADAQAAKEAKEAERAKKKAEREAARASENDKRTEFNPDEFASSKFSVWSERVAEALTSGEEVFSKMIVSLGRMEGEVKRLLDSRPGGHLTRTDIVSLLRNAKSALKTTKPVCPCPRCKGKGGETCCKGAGWWCSQQRQQLETASETQWLSERGF